MDIKQKPIERLAYLEMALYTLCPPADPPATHWLAEDSCENYCYECAKAAVAKSKGLDGWPQRPAGFSHEWSPEQEAAYDLINELEEEIDGGFDTHSDSSHYCTTCGKLLSYLLTEYGASEELAHFSDCKIQAVDPELTYEISRVCLGLSWIGAPMDQVEQAIQIVRRAIGVAASGVPEAPRAVVVMEGGCVQTVLSDTALDVHVLDYDIEGGDGETFAIPQDDQGKVAPAYRSGGCWNEVNFARVSEILRAPMIVAASPMAAEQEG